MKHTKLSIAFFALGTVCIIAAISIFFYNQAEANRAYEASQVTVSKLTELIEVEEPGVFPTDNYDREMPKTEIDGNDYIGVLSISELELKLPVSAENNYDMLDIAPCLYSGSIYRNDIVIAAHNYDSHFGRIAYLPIGSEIIFTDTENNDYKFEVISVETLAPHQTDEMKNKTNANDWDLTLFTCTYGGENRITVRCKKTLL